MSIGLAIGTHLGRVFGATSAYLNRSTFTAANGTALTAYTPEVGGAWAAVKGTWGITGNQAFVTSAGEAIATVDAGSADVVVEAALTMQPLSNFGIMVRTPDVTSGWLCSINGTSAFLYEKTGGSYAQRASSAVTVANGATVPMRVAASGSTITVYVNNVQQFSYASATSNQAVTRHGIRADTTTPAVDDFTVRRPA